MENLKIQSKHGVYKQEHHVEQEFAVNIEVKVSTESAVEHGTLESTLDYDNIRNLAKDVFAAKQEHLIERLAAHIGDRILTFPQAKEVSVTIRKTEVWKDGTPGVTIRRSK